MQALVGCVRPARPPLRRRPLGARRRSSAEHRGARRARRTPRPLPQDPPALPRRRPLRRPRRGAVEGLRHAGRPSRDRHLLRAPLPRADAGPRPERRGARPASDQLADRSEAVRRLPDAGARCREPHLPADREPRRRRGQASSSSGGARSWIPLGDRLVEAGEREDELVLAEIEPAEARDKHRAIVPGEYEVDLFDDRRPELYGALVEEARPVHAPLGGGRQMATTEESLTYEAILEKDGVKVSKSPWGADDEIGRLNWITPESQKAILERLDGTKVFDLSVDYFIGMPSWSAAGDPEVRHLDDAHSAGLGERQPVRRRPRGAREVQLLRRLDVHVHALRHAHRHAQPPRLLRLLLERLDGREAPRQPPLDGRRHREVPEHHRPRRPPRHRRAPRRRLPAGQLRGDGRRPRRRPPASRASSSAAATSSACAWAG